MDDPTTVEIKTAAYALRNVAARLQSQVNLRRSTATKPLIHWTGPHAETFATQVDRQSREGQAIVDALLAVARRADAAVAS